ncbi:MAG: PhoX family protein [Rhodospirillales bacterium]
MYDRGDEGIDNPSGNPTLTEVMAARASRRGVLVGGLTAAVAVALAGSWRPAAAAEKAADEKESLLGFAPVPVGEADAVRVPEGYRVQVLAPWGTPLDGSGGFSPAATGAEQARQVGSHHDGMHFFPIEGSSTDGLLVVNHEYVEPRFLHRAYAGRAVEEEGVVIENGVRNADEVLKELNAHGVTVVHVRRGQDGEWALVPDPRNRRITGLTPARFSGPARGAAKLRTKYSPDGTRVRGTLNNCAHGPTPWNTYLAAEENWALYFRNGDVADDKPNLPREHARYGVRTDRSRYAWELAQGGGDEYVRFDASTRAGDPASDFRKSPTP